MTLLRGMPSTPLTMKTVEVRANRTIVLPKHLFKPFEKVALLTQGKVLIIKKLEPTPLSSIAKRVKAPTPPLRSITREVHAYRRAHRAQ